MKVVELRVGEGTDHTSLQLFSMPPSTLMERPDALRSPAPDIDSYDVRSNRSVIGVP